MDAKSLSVRMTVNDALSDVSFQQGCLELLAQYYSNPDIVLRYALDGHASHIYYRRGDDGNIHAAFFARTPELVMKDFPLVGYMGLTATASTGNDKHQARALWSDYLTHARQVAQTSAAVAWYRTASPFGLYPCHHLLHDGEPRDDGGFSDAGAVMVGKLRTHYGLPSNADDGHPFVVRRYASARYSEFEQNRIALLGGQKAVGLFSQLAIKEQRGDRLLLLGRIP